MRYRARMAASRADLDAALRLRGRAFRNLPTGEVADRFDAACRHVLIEDSRDGNLVCCYRLLLLDDGGGLGQSYAAQYYDLAPLARYRAPMLEMGRFCVAPDHSDPDILRHAWAALTRFVDDNHVKMLFGCTSFAGIDPHPYREAFALLHQRHLAPAPLRPVRKAAERVEFPDEAAMGNEEFAKAIKQLPTLLRSYLTLGGFVSDHGVIDRDLTTIHVFTALEVDQIPPVRARLLRQISSF